MATLEKPCRDWHRMIADSGYSRSDATCGECEQLRRWRGRLVCRYACGAFRPSNVWRTGWLACSAFERREGDVEAQEAWLGWHIAWSR